MADQPTRQLNLFDAVCIIVGVIVGSGIYKIGPDVAANTGSVSAAMGVWVFGGLTALVAALCYAELSTSFPRVGGDFVYLSEAFHPRLGSLFAWCEFWIIRPGNIGMLSYVFGNYASKIFPLGMSADNPKLDSTIYAAAAVVVLTGTNLAGVRTGKITQNTLTVLKVVGLLAISAFLFTLSSAKGAATPAATDGAGGSLRFAILMAMFAYGGWADMVNVASEVKQPRKNLLLALVCGAFAVMTIYLCANAAFFHALGFQGVASSQAVAVDAMDRWAEGWGSLVVGVLVAVSCLGAVSAMLMTGSRIIYAAGAATPYLRFLGRWNARFDAPVAALLAQCGMTLLLIVGLGWSNDGFSQLLIFTSPVYWFFALLVAIGLFVLRNRTPDDKQPFRTPLFPLIPILFVLLCGFMLYSGVSWAYMNRDYAFAALSSLTVVALGALFVMLTPSEKPTA